MTPTPKGRLFWDKKCKIDVFLLYSEAQTKNPEYLAMMTKEESTKIVNFNIPDAGQGFLC